MELQFRLFNCDRTFNLDKVEALITKVRPHAKVDKRYFALPRMSELCDELSKEEKFEGYIVFVVHAHESRLSLNEANAGIGYAKLYRTLLKITDDRVFIVIGGDNNYKVGEHEYGYLSKWAWRKICSQFTEDFMDGTKSFIFSWDNNHQPIHEEALTFYLSPQKPQQKFVPKPKPSVAHIKPAGNVVPKPPVAHHKPAGIDTAKSHSLEEQFPSEKNKDRPLPTQPISQEVTMEEPVENVMDQQEPCKQEQTMAFPAVHILSILSNRDEILQNNILDLLCEAFRSFSVPCGPYVPNIPPQYLLQHVKDTRPDVVVLVSEFDDLNDVENVPQAQQRFKDLFRAVKDEETKMVFVVTCDPKYIEGDLNSRQVEQKVKNINTGTGLKDDQLTIVSWKDLPCPMHRDVFTNLLQLCKPKRCQSKTSSIMPPESDAQEGLLRYSAVIKDGCILAVLQSDPYHWRPEDSFMRALLERNRDRTKVYVWDNNGKITATVPTAERTLREVLVAGPTERRQALQVYSYHLDENTFQTVYTFIKGLGFQHSPLKNPIGGAAIFQNIQNIKSGYVAFSTDAKVLDDEPTLQSQLAKFLPYFQAVVGNLKGIIIMVIGDQNYSDGGLELASFKVKQTIESLAARIPLIQDKITVMFWKSEPFTTHQNMMNTLLQKSPQPSYQSQGNPRHAATGRQGRPAYQDDREPTNLLQKSPQPSYQSQGNPRHAVTGGQGRPAYQDHDNKREPTNSLPKETFDPTKGYLRYRADLEYGRVRDVKTCYPLDWRPDQRDLDFLLNRYEKTPKAVLEFWGKSFDGPIDPPVVKVDEKPWYKKWPFKSSSNDQDEHA